MNKTTSGRSRHGERRNDNYWPVSVGDWMVTYLIMLIPLINIIMLFVWAFSGGTPVSKANWAKASLIWLLIGVIFYIIVFAVLGAALFGALSSM